MLVSCGRSSTGGLAEGERLLREGKTDKSIQILKVASTASPEDWRIFNLLGMAHHRAGNHAEAMRAYKEVEALVKRDPSLIHKVNVVYYNRGRLYLDAGKAVKAADELAAYTQEAKQSFAGHYWRGTAELLAAKQSGRQEMLDRAETSLRKAIELKRDSAEAFNRLALVFLHQGDAERALASFQRARQVDAKFAPAILNLAILHQRHPVGGPKQGKQKALQLYLEYLALDDGKLVRREAAQQALNRLNNELNPALLAGLGTGTELTPVAPVVPLIGRLVESNQVVSVRFPKGGNGPVRGTIISNLPSRTLRPPLARVRPPAVPPDSQPPVQPKPPTEVVQVPEPPKPVKPVAPPKPAPITPKPEPPQVAKVEPPQPVPVTPKPEPSKPQEVEEPLPNLPNIARYQYQKQVLPKKGDRDAANKHFKKALHSHKLNQLETAMEGYRKALAADPGYQQAYGNLALAADRAGDLAASLKAYEIAISLNPLSLDSRYNFALALNKGEYYIDAARELDRLLRDYPEHLSGHLQLANLLDKQLEQPRRARTHYAKVIKLNPSHAQASSIRQWLSEHP
ncbi:MAG: tetratricopeptide repeat protein [Verrucomicrobiota bacterium]|nr:tetratricopeptide repeat protein [Verrucomicrobiota bacterium]